MTVAVVPYQPGGQSRLYPSQKTSPYSLYWWSQSYVNGVPDESVGWMVAQGWEIVNVQYDQNTTPPTPYYALSRKSLQNWKILQSLLNEYTIAVNEAQLFNTARYNEVIQAWSTMLDTSQTHFQNETATNNAYVTIYTSTINTLMATAEYEVDSIAREVANGKAAVALLLPKILSDLNKFNINYQAHAATIETLLASQAGYVTAYLAAHETALGQLTSDFATYLAAIRMLETSLDTNVTSHITSYQTQLAAILSDFTTHKATALAFLNDLGTTELARINEAWDAKAAEVRQSTMDQGFYSTPLLADKLVLVERERNEQIAALNDRLAREQLTNEHQLYEQQAGLRTRTMEGLSILQNVRNAVTQLKLENEGRLGQEHRSVRGAVAEGIDRRHGVQQDVSRTLGSERQRLLTDKQASVSATIQSRVAHEEATLRNAEFSVSNRHQIARQRMDNYVRRIAGIEQTHDWEMKLYAYQLSERNNLLTGLYGFVKDRTDEAPDFSNLVQIAAGLGDSGGSWITP